MVYGGKRVFRILDFHEPNLFLPFPFSAHLSLKSGKLAPGENWAHNRIKENKSMRLFDKIEIDEPTTPFVYVFTIIDNDSNVYQYVGGTVNPKRLNRYPINIKNLRAGRAYNYRAVHYAINEAIENDWDIMLKVKPSTEGDVLLLEQQFIIQLNPILNKLDFEGVKMLFDG